MPGQKDSRQKDSSAKRFQIPSKKIPAKRFQRKTIPKQKDSRAKRFQKDSRAKFFSVKYPFSYIFGSYQQFGEFLALFWESAKFVTFV
jgi:hypothetical protein